MFLCFVTPEKEIVVDQEVDEVILPAFRGQLCILPGHAPLMTTLDIGILKYKLKGSDSYKESAISWGYCEVSPKNISVLADTAENKDDVDKVRAKETLESSEKQLKSGELSSEQIVKFQRKSQRARTRLSL